VALLFFGLAFLAAITSAVSLLEVPVACLMDRLNWTRSRAVWVSTAVIFVLGLPAATSLGVLGWMDSVFGGLLLILGGVATGSFARLGGAPTLLRRFGTVVHPSGAAPFPPGVVALGVPTDRCYGPGDQRDRPVAGVS